MDLENNPQQTDVSPTPPSLKQLNFFGQASEYFVIWIINLLLTLVTLGIYGPWAKVRRINYMLGNVELDGHRFKYLGNPVNILKGRIIAAVTFIALSFAVTKLQGFALSSEGFTQAILLLFSVLIMYVMMSVFIWKSLQFTFSMISYRGIRFSFTGSYAGVVGTFFFMPLLASVSLGFLAPLTVKKIISFMSNNVKYGALHFKSELTLNQCVKPVVIVLLSSITMIILSMVTISFSMTQSGMGQPNVSVVFAFYILFFLFVFVIQAFVAAMFRNLLVQNLKLSKASYFDSQISPLKLAFISGTNFLAILFSLGLATPWAQIRKYKYITECTQAALSSEVESVITKEQDSPSAIGLEGAEIMDIGVGL